MRYIRFYAMLCYMLCYSVCDVIIRLFESVLDQLPCKDMISRTLGLFVREDCQIKNAVLILQTNHGALLLSHITGNSVELGGNGDEHIT